MSYHRSRELRQITDEILKYTGKEKDPQLRIAEPGEHAIFIGLDSDRTHSSLAGNFKRLCIVRADLSKVASIAVPGILAGEIFRKQYKLILRFGTET